MTGRDSFDNVCDILYNAWRAPRIDWRQTWLTYLLIILDFDSVCSFVELRLCGRMLKDPLISSTFNYVHLPHMLSN